MLEYIVVLKTYIAYLVHMWLVHMWFAIVK